MTPQVSPSRVEHATSLSPIRRNAIAVGYFAHHPGSDRGAAGLGRAVIEFLDWEILSGRVRSVHGSPWWQLVNGLLILDLHDAEQGDPSTAGAAAWLEYQGCGPACAQAAFWVAHQRSLTDAASAALPVLTREPEGERELTQIVLDVVAQAAAFEVRTDTGLLGSAARELYPSEYPATGPRVDQLRADLAQRGILMPSPVTD